ncbi:unnamed protein product [Rotaria sp. Silwood1]|nr:unnamed protein product [Rotaria sp. Silwood1]
MTSVPINQRIQKVIVELIATEKSYVQHRQNFLKQYIEPLCNNSTILPSDAIESLYNSIKSIYQLQIIFLENLKLNLLTENILI